MYGLVLEGGGSKGSYQIGACKAISELGLEIVSVAGTSVGALNGAMVVQGDVDSAYDIWYEINPDHIIRMTGDELENYVENAFKPDALKTFIRRIKKIIADKGLDVGPLVELVKSVLDEDRIRKSPIGFGIVTVDVTERKAVEIYKEEIPEGQLVDYVIASASFPAFKRAVIDGKVFVDGAFYNVLPVNMVSSKGFRDIIVLRTYGIGIKKHVDTSGLNLITISPTESLGPTLDFSTRTSRKNLNMGYYDTYRVFRKLKGSKYYVYPINDDHFFIDYLAGMSEEKIKRICGLFGLNTNSRRALFEEIVPRVSNLLDLPPKASYEDIAIALLERAAENLGIERFQFYTFQELYALVLQKNIAQCDEFIKESTGFLRNAELLPKLAKDRLLGGIAGELFVKE